MNTNEIKKSIQTPYHKSLLFVCLGNICRSPSAEGIFKFLANKHHGQVSFTVDSAGTHDYHINKAPDDRAIKALKKVGIDISNLRGRQLSLEDFLTFDYILVMDQRNLDFIKAFCPSHYLNKVLPIMSFDTQTGLDFIQDPYHRQPEDFDKMVNELLPVCQQLLDTIEDNVVYEQVLADKVEA